MMKSRRFTAFAFAWSIVLLSAAAFAAQAASGKPAFKPNPRLAALPDNTIVDLGPFKWERPKGERWIGSVTDYSGMTYDPHHNRILLFGGGHSTTATDAIYVFDFKTLTWKALYTPTPAKFFEPENNDRSFWKKGPTGWSYPRPMGRHTYALLIVPEHRKELLLLRNGGFYTENGQGKGHYSGGDTNGAGGIYDFKSGRWAMIPAKDLGFGGYGSGALYDPVSRKVFGFAEKRMYLFDPATRKSRVVWWNVPARFSVFYFPPARAYYWLKWKEREVWEVRFNRRDFAKSALVKTAMRIPETVCPGMMAHDTKNRLMGGCLSHTWNDKKYRNRFSTFNPATGRWETKKIRGGTPNCLSFYCFVYSPVDNVYIFIGQGPDGHGEHTWAYRWKR